MGKKKTNQAQQTQRLVDVDDNLTDNSMQTNRPSQKLTEEKVNRVHDIFPDWPKADIRRALEDNDYDEERVVQSHLQGGDSWQEVSKPKVKETVSRKSKRTVSGNQNQNERVERGMPSQRGRGGGRGGKTVTRSDRKTDTDVTAASVKEFTPTTVDDTVQTRSFRSYSEAAAVSNEQPVVVPVVAEPVTAPTKPERKERPKRERIIKKDTPQLQYVQDLNSPPSPQTRHLPSDTILPPQPTTQSVVQKTLSPQDKKEAVVLPVGFNAVDVQFGSLGINDTEQAQANVVEKDSHPSAPSLDKPESQTEPFYGQAWGGSEQYQTEPVTQYEEGAPSQYQQQYQQQQLYGFQQQPTQTQQQPRTGGDKGAQRTSPNLQYGKPSYTPTHPYTGIHSGAQNPYQYPAYPSYPPPYMMPNQFQYHNYPMPGNKYGQFYGQNKPYNAYAPTTGANATAPTTEESNLDYNKQFEMNQYFYMQQQQQGHPQQPNAQQDTGKVKKDSRSPNDQTGDAQQQQHQQQQAFGHYPYAMHYGHYMFQPQQSMGFQPQQQYPPQPTTQQGAQSHGKSSRDQQQQSSLTGSTWQ